MQRVEVDLADRAPIGSHHRREILRKRHLREAFQDFLTVPVVLGLIVENEHHAGKAEERRRAQMLEMRQTVHQRFDRNGDLLLDFFRRPAWPLGDEVDVVVRHVRVRLDRQVVKREDAPDEQQQRDSQDKKSVFECVIDETADHS
jgi:hypothetical protein